VEPVDILTRISQWKAAEVVGIVEAKHEVLARLVACGDLEGRWLVDGDVSRLGAPSVTALRPRNFPLPADRRRA
jgi:hypothetical protein